MVDKIIRIFVLHPKRLGGHQENFVPPTQLIWLRSSDTLMAAETNIWNTFWLTGTFRDSKKITLRIRKGREPCEYYLEQGVDTMFWGNNRETTCRKNLQKERSKTTGPEDVKQSQGLSG